MEGLYGRILGLTVYCMCSMFEHMGKDCKNVSKAADSNSFELLIAIPIISCITGKHRNCAVLTKKREQKKQHYKDYKSQLKFLQVNLGRGRKATFKLTMYVVGDCGGKRRDTIRYTGENWVNQRYK